MKSLKSAGDEQFVDALYLKLLARAPDPEGRKAMLAMLAKGADRLEVIDVFFRSEEFGNLRQPLAFAPPGHFYSPYPGRREIEAHRSFDWSRACSNARWPSSRRSRRATSSSSTRATCPSSAAT